MDTQNQQSVQTSAEPIQISFSFKMKNNFQSILAGIILIIAVQLMTFATQYVVPDDYLTFILTWGIMFTFFMAGPKFALLQGLSEALFFTAFRLSNPNLYIEFLSFSFIIASLYFFYIRKKKISLNPVTIVLVGSFIGITNAIFIMVLNILIYGSQPSYGIVSDVRLQKIFFSLVGTSPIKMHFLYEIMGKPITLLISFLFYNLIRRIFHSQKESLLTFKVSTFLLLFSIIINYCSIQYIQNKNLINLSIKEKLNLSSDNASKTGFSKLGTVKPFQKKIGYTTIEVEGQKYTLSRLPFINESDEKINEELAIDVKKRILTTDNTIFFFDDSNLFLYREDVNVLIKTPLPKAISKSRAYEIKRWFLSNTTSVIEIWEPGTSVSALFSYIYNNVNNTLTLAPELHCQPEPSCNGVGARLVSKVNNTDALIIVFDNFESNTSLKLAESRVLLFKNDEGILENLLSSSANTKYHYLGMYNENVILLVTENSVVYKKIVLFDSISKSQNILVSRQNIPNDIISIIYNSTFKHIDFHCKVNVKSFNVQTKKFTEDQTLNHNEIQENYYSMTPLLPYVTSIPSKVTDSLKYSIDSDQVTPSFTYSYFKNKSYVEDAVDKQIPIDLTETIDLFNSTTLYPYSKDLAIPPRITNIGLLTNNELIFEVSRSESGHLGNALDLNVNYDSELNRRVGIVDYRSGLVRAFDSNHATNLLWVDAKRNIALVYSPLFYYFGSRISQRRGGQYTIIDLKMRHFLDINIDHYDGKFYGEENPSLKGVKLYQLMKPYVLSRNYWGDSKQSESIYVNSRMGIIGDSLKCDETSCQFDVEIEPNILKESASVPYETVIVHVVQSFDGNITFK